MSFSIGTSGGGMGGPRGMISSFGDAEKGKAFDRQIIVRLLAYLKPHWRRMTFAFILMLVSTGLTLATPYLIKIAIDDYIIPGNLNGLGQISLILAGSFVLLYGATAGQQYLLSWVGQRVLATLRHQLFDHLQRLSLSYYDRSIVGVTISRVINDVAVINQLLSEGLVRLISDLLVLGGIIIVMLTLSPTLALATFSVLPLMVIATYIFSRQARVAFRETRARVAALVGDLAEGIASMRVIQAFAQENTAQDRFDEVNQANREAHIRAISLSFVFLPSVEFLGMLATGVVLWFGGLAVAQGSLTLGVVVAFLAYVTRFFQPIQELSQIYTTMQSAMAGGEQVLRLLDTEPAVADRPNAGEMPDIQGQVTLQDVEFAYVEDTPVLQGVNLTIEPGQTVALVGPTGAGKTTIANLVARFYDVTGGTVFIDGIDVRDVTQQSLRRQTGLVPQDPFIFSGTIADNIAFGRPNTTPEAIEEAARLSNAHDFIALMPDGYETEILEGGVNLSLGQRQLICIARAVLADPKLLILDEATSNVDTVTEVIIQEALERLLEGRTAIVIAHRLSTIRQADLICVIDGGKIVEQGPHEELLAQDGLYANLYERQFLTQVADELDD